MACGALVACPVFAQVPPACVDPANDLNPYVQVMCRHVTKGQPIPSKIVLRLPAYGSGEAKRLGFACIGGQSMRRLENGWEQVLDAERRTVRCTSP